MTHFIFTEPLAKKLVPDSGVIRSALELVSQGNVKTETDKATTSDQDGEPNKSTPESSSPSVKHSCPTSGN